MKTDYLLPHIFRKIGWFVFIPCWVMIIVSWLGINDWFDDDWLSLVTLHIGNLGFFTPEQEGHSFLYFAREDMFSEIIYCLAFVSLYMIAFSKDKVDDGGVFGCFLLILHQFLLCVRACCVNCSLHWKGTDKPFFVDANEYFWREADELLFQPTTV